MNDSPASRTQEEIERQRLGERLREARKYVGLTQEDVAAHLKIQRTALGDIESGQRRVEAIELTRMAPPWVAGGRLSRGDIGRGGRSRVLRSPPGYP